MAAYPMWLYCSHEPMMGCFLDNFEVVTGMCNLTFVGKIRGTPPLQTCEHYSGMGYQVAYLVLYLVFPWVWVAMLLAIGSLLRKYLLFVYNLLTGGRGGAAGKRKQQHLQEQRQKYETSVGSSAAGHTHTHARLSSSSSFRASQEGPKAGGPFMYPVTAGKA
eukprot:CAMPEP_0175127148 /NCGR_PEP_ID=MMETSP0087-20121206/4237_1 /TAXON_ID=136419 /ORGANISM="Unknown Unknown, Strain D1" /LENGTH=161 /DNA_ID=CAMNT_0016409117 /DNA_START=926 /DNA_END=1411 /DNA_ORIENTATION=+